MSEDLSTLPELRNEADLTAAITEIDKLMELGDALSPEQGERLVRLSDLVEKYEDIHYPMPGDK